MTKLTCGRFSIIPSQAYEDKRLNFTTIAILGVISAHGNQKRGGWCYLYQQSIAERLGLKKNAVRHHITRLIKFGYLEKKPTYLKSGAQSYNYYRVNLNFDLSDEDSRLIAGPDEDKDETPPPVSVQTPPPIPTDTPGCLYRPPHI